MTSPTPTRPPVPQLRREVTGETYGGQYWHSAEYEVTLTAPTQDAAFVLALEDTSGTVVDSEEFTLEHAHALRAALTTATSTKVVDGIAGLEATIVWNLGLSQSDNVTLDLGVLTEINEWLGYALGVTAWDWDENGDTWDY